MDTPLIGRIRSSVGALAVPAQIRDLHVWRVSRSKFACLLSVATEDEAAVEQFHQALAGHAELAHLTVEVRREPAAGFGRAGGDCREGT
jgi:Co/Zn/Cd efflux system component